MTALYLAEKQVRFFDVASLPPLAFDTSSSKITSNMVECIVDVFSGLETLNLELSTYYGETESCLMVENMSILQVLLESMTQLKQLKLFYHVTYGTSIHDSSTTASFHLAVTGTR